jgi:hypothetical protein
LTGAPAQAHNHLFSLSLSLSLTTRVALQTIANFMSFWGVSCQFFIFKNQKHTTKKRIVAHGFVLFFQFCEVSKWVGDSDFLLAKFRNLATGRKKKRG